MGTPNEEMWPGVTTLTDYHTTFPRKNNESQLLRLTLFLRQLGNRFSFKKPLNQLVNQLSPILWPFISSM